MKPLSSASSDPVDAAAALWLSRRDRGLTSAEQDEYLLWLAADPRHAEAVTRHAATLERMMQLYEWQPGHDSEPNPDLFAPTRRPRWWLWSGGLAAAAVVLGLFILPSRPAGPALPVARTYLRVNERLALPDGSRVELKDGSKVVIQYSETERRVKLTGGEAHFTVWKDKSRPFIVDVGGIEVRAVGTAFNIRLDSQAVHVLVTEGKVSVERPDAATPGTPGETASQFVTVGQQAVVPLTPQQAPAIASVTTEDIARALDWQAPRLEFNETPIADAVAEFNRLNRHQMEISDPGLAQQRIGGTFRPDNVEGFIRMLATALDVQAQRLDEERTVLHPAR